MGLLHRKPRKAIKVSEVAKILGCGRDTVKRIAKQEGWLMWSLTDGPTAPLYVYEAEVMAYLEKRQSHI
jgi:hypothetical protein